jgi:hypothetical protein
MIVRIALIAAALTLGASACSRAGATTVSTLAEIQAAWKAAHDGDTIVLAKGATILDFRPTGRTFSKRVTIDTTPGTIGGWYGGHGGGVNLKVGKVIPGNKYPLGIRFDSMNDLTIDGTRSDFEGPSTIPGSAIQVLSGKNIAIIAPKVRGFMNGVALSKVDTFVIAYGDFSGMGADGVDYANSQNGHIHHNYAHDGNHVPSKHPDGFQGWSGPKAAQTRDIEIDHNRVGAGFQGITFFNHPNAGQQGVTNLNIHDNTVIGSYPQGIAVTDGDMVTIENNQVSTIPGSQFQTTINLKNCTNVSRYNNHVVPYLRWKGLTDPRRPADRQRGRER